MGAITLRGTKCIHLTWLLFLLSCTQKRPQIAGHAAGCFSELSLIKSKPHSSCPRMGWKICPFLLFGMPSICISIAHLCYDSALGNRNGCKVNMLGTQGTSPWITLPSWKRSWWGETQSPTGSSPSTVCDLLAVRDLWVLWTSLRAPPLQHPVTGDYLNPVRLHKQNWKRHMRSDLASPRVLWQQWTRCSRPSEKANC